MNVNTICTIKQQCQMLLLAIMLAFGVAGAQANPPELVGDWEMFNLLSDGTGDDGYGPISWKVQGDSIVINELTGQKNRYSHQFKISGKKLTLTKTGKRLDESGESWENYIETTTLENKKEENDKKRAEVGKKLISNWIRTTGKIADAKLELLDGGTGTSGGSPITWKLIGGVTIERGRYSSGSMMFTKKINGKETTVAYGFSIFSTADPVIPYEVLRLTDRTNGKDSEYKRKEDLDEIARIKKEAKQSISFTDSRDKKKYKAVKIDGKTWMAENLNFKTDNSLCFGKKDANCTKYGRLYTWDEAKKACPEGWHLPKKEEWDALFKAEYKVANYGLNDENAADKNGDFLRAKTGWSAFKGGRNGNNELGFSALPGGYKYGDDFGGQDAGADISGFWWMDLDKKANAGFAKITTGIEAAGMYSKAKLVGVAPRTDADIPKSDGLSVRCVQD